MKARIIKPVVKLTPAILEQQVSTVLKRTFQLHGGKLYDDSTPAEKLGIDLDSLIKAQAVVNAKNAAASANKKPMPAGFETAKVPPIFSGTSLTGNLN